MVVSWIKFLRNQDYDISFNLKNIVSKILIGDFYGLNVKQLEGKKGYYRCRVGKIRIIFYKSNNTYNIEKIGYRGDVYK